MIKCSKCGHMNLDSDRFCGECGNKLSEPANYCPNCNRTYNNLNKFCTQCGTKLVVKSSYSKRKSTTIKNNSSPTSQDYTRNQKSNYKVKPEINQNKETVIIVDNYENNTPNYFNYTNQKLEKMLQNAKDKQEYCLKTGDVTVHIYTSQINSIEQELRNRKEGTHKIPDRNEQIKIQEHRYETAKKMLDMKLQNAKKNKSKKNTSKQLNKPSKNNNPNQTSNSKNKNKKSSKNKNKWKVCTKCYMKVYAPLKLCPYCNGRHFYVEDDQKYDEKYTKKDNIKGIKSKRLQNKLKFM